jgi:magnesium-transporting ATPase (P-type)
VCSDKTGTLTENEMTIQEAVTPSGDVEVTGTGYPPAGELRAGGHSLGEGPLLEEVRALIGAGSLATDAVLQQDSGEWRIQGDPTEASFLAAEAKIDCLAEARRARFERVGEIPFKSERRLMTTLQTDARASSGS